ncbi:MAG: hypothetical protein WD749_14410 [Phycisphaerales bacterium]
MQVDTGYVTRPTVRSFIPRRVSWGAIFSGTFVALAVWVLLLLLGTAVASATINPMRETQPGEGVAIGLGIWWLVVSIGSLFVGGWVAARLAPTPSRVEASLHGAVVWGLTTVILLYVVTTSAAKLAGGALGTMQTAVTAGAQVASTPRAQEELSRFEGRFEGRRMSQAERDRAIDDLMSRGMSYREAQFRVDQMEQQQQGGRLMASPEQWSEQDLRQAGQTAADTLAATAAWSFFALLLGLAAALAGGATGRTRTFERDMED